VIGWTDNVGKGQKKSEYQKREKHTSLDISGTKDPMRKLRQQEHGAFNLF
jgi:hypothetical protein